MESKFVLENRVEENPLVAYDHKATSRFEQAGPRLEERQVAWTP